MDEMERRLLMGIRVKMSWKEKEACEEWCESGAAFVGWTTCIADRSVGFLLLLPSPPFHCIACLSLTTIHTQSKLDSFLTRSEVWSYFKLKIDNKIKLIIFKCNIICLIVIYLLIYVFTHTLNLILSVTKIQMQQWKNWICLFYLTLYRFQKVINTELSAFLLLLSVEEIDFDMWIFICISLILIIWTFHTNIKSG